MVDLDAGTLNLRALWLEMVLVDEWPNDLGLGCGSFEQWSLEAISEHEPDTGEEVFLGRHLVVDLLELDWLASSIRYLVVDERELGSQVLMVCKFQNLWTDSG